jgi:hypothetical protein
MLKKGSFIVCMAMQDIAIIICLFGTVLFFAVLNS